MKLREILDRVNVEAVENALKHRVLNVELSTLAVVAAMVAYTVVFSFFMIMKDYSFRTYAWDLGIFNQALWTTVHDGKFFYYTSELLINPSGSFFGIHVSPILFLILPFYALSPSTQTLLVIQSFVLALSALPLYKLVKTTMGYRLVGLLFVFIYLLYPPLHGINWFDFHVQSFLPLFFFSAFYFFEKQGWKAYFLFVTLALIVEEHAAIVVVFIGLFGLLLRRKQFVNLIKSGNFKDTVLRVSVATVILAMLWYLITLWIRTSFFPINPSFAYEFKAAANWSILGIEDPILVPLYVLLYPARAIAALGYDFLAKIAYLLILFGPLALKSFYKMRYLVPAIPWLFLALFSNYLPYYAISNQYPAYVIAFIFIAAVYAIDKIKEDWKALRKNMATIFICSLVASIMISPLSPVVSLVYPEYGPNPITQHEEFIHEILRYIPQNASVMTQSNIFPHVSNRINSYAIPAIHHMWRGKASEFEDFTRETLEKMEYILVDFESDPAAARLIFPLLQQDSRFKVLVSAESIFLFKKDFYGQTRILAPYETTYDYRNLSLYSGEFVEDLNSTSGIILCFNGTSGISPLFWHGPRSFLPPGEYNVTLRLKLNATSAITAELFTIEFCSDNGQNILFAETISNSDFLSDNVWLSKTYNIVVDNPLVDFEVRASNISTAANIYLDYIKVEEVIPSS